MKEQYKVESSIKLRKKTYNFINRLGTCLNRTIFDRLRKTIKRHIGGTAEVQKTWFLLPYIT